MTHITWNDAEAFTKKLNKLTGLPFSLPTEAQWEYAAAGGESYPYAGSDNIRDVAYYASNANEMCIRDRKKRLPPKYWYKLPTCATQSRSWMKE